jgi:hypothetical protein
VLARAADLGATGSIRDDIANQPQAELAEKALRAAQAALETGPFGPITDAEITQALAAFWQYVGSINATANTLIPIPG